MRLPVVLFTLLFLYSFGRAQDTVYARKVVKFLTSKKCFGRGYLKNGLQKAEKYILSEIKEQGALPLFNGQFTQAFSHPVNTFPGPCKIKLNGRELQPGFHYIIDPTSSSAKGTCKLMKADTINYICVDKKVAVQTKGKLTFGVARSESGSCRIEVDKTRFKEEPSEISFDVKNKLIADFKSENLGCFVNGRNNSDSMVVFSAHYDHLGGMGSSAFFPGANDNASGVSMVLDLIRYYKSNPPKYKTVFLFFAGEEAGLLGSKFFVDSKAVDLKKIKFLINLDLLGTGDEGIMVVNGAIHEKEFAMLNKMNAEKNLVAVIKKRGKAANSDHYWFSEAGVPCFFIYTTGGIKAYHDVFDIEKTLPLTDYVDVHHLITAFAGQL